MPAWLLPTGRFGIGLQSLFQADRIFKCVTRTHRDECFEMTFHSGTNNEGYINVIPKEWRDGENSSVPYGTKFTLFVPQNRKQTHTVNMSGWAGMDPYAEDYAAGRPLRRAVELMKQMEAQIDSWVGECLFPVVIREERLDISLCQAGWEKRLTPHTEPKMIKINFQQVDPRTHKTEKHSESNRQLCWLFTRHNKKPFLWGDLEDKSASYYIDDEHCTLHIWSQEASCFFACNSNRIVRAITKDPVLGGNKQEEQGKKIKIFLKGLLINELIYEDDELIEYIDIKNDQLQEYLYMSRNAFSTQGEQIIKNDIIPLLRKAFHNVLKHINQTAITVIGNNRSDITDKIVDHYLQINSEEINDFSETDPVYIRKRDLLEKKLNACDLFDFTVVGRDIRRALPNSDEERRLNEFFWRPIQKGPQEDLQENFLENVQEDLLEDLHSCYRIHKCIPQELFQDFPNSDAVRKRMETTLRSKIDKLCEQNQDIFSHQLDIFLEKMGSLYRCFFDETYQPSRVDIIDDAKWIRNFTILHAMLFFYTQQGSFPSKSGCISSGQEPCGWAYVNRRIAYALMDLREADKYLVSNHKEFIKEVEELLFVPAIAEKGRSTLSESRCSLAELMLPENQFAVFSTRQSRFDPWKHMLIRLHPLSNHSLFLAELDRALGGPDIYHVVSRFESDPNILDVLKYCPKDKSECAARWAFLDYWFYFYISKIMKEWFIQVTSLPTGEGFGDGSRVTEDIWGNLITKWIVRKLPSVALGADPSGNNRMNVLSPRTEPYIFYDARMLQLLVKRIEERYRHFHANRFVTSVWDGLDALACEGVSTNILSVNRGTIPAETKKTQMLLAFGSVLPQPLSLDMIPASMAAQNTISQPESESRKIQTFFELLNAVQECYRGNGVVPDFKLRQLHKLMKEFHSIQELQPFHNKYRDSDHKLVKLLQDYYTDHSDSLKRTIDRKLMARNQRVLEETIEMNYAPNDISARIVPRYFTYAETNIPIDRQTFMCAFFLTLYKFDLATLPDELRTDITRLLYGDDTSKVLNLQPYANKDELYDTYINIRAAQEYCNHWAKTDFRNAFLECICDWYWENVWKKGRASSFLAFTRDHQSVSRTDQELESLYRTQLRRIFCAAIDGIETEYLK